MDVSFIEPSNLSALIKFVTSIYIQSPEMAKKMLEKEFWSALVSCLIPSPVKSVGAHIVLLIKRTITVAGCIHCIRRH